MDKFPYKTITMKKELSPAFAFDILYYTVNTPRSYCIKLDESIETEDYSAEAIISLSTTSAEQILAKIKGNNQGEISLSIWSYDEEIIGKFLANIAREYSEVLIKVHKCDQVHLQDLRSGIAILKELDRVYYYALTGQKYRRIYFMLADSRERLYKIMIKGLYGTFNPALIEMQSYLGMLLRRDQESSIKEPESVKVGLAALKWKGYMMVLLKGILAPEEE